MGANVVAVDISDDKLEPHVGRPCPSTIPMDRVIAHELQIMGNHGMQAFRYDALFDMLNAGRIAPDKLAHKRLSLQEAPAALMNMDSFEGLGMQIITEI